MRELKKSHETPMNFCLQNPFQELIDRKKDFINKFLDGRQLIRDISVHKIQSWCYIMDFLSMS